MSTAVEDREQDQEGCDKDAQTVDGSVCLRIL
jgi:hypothetical protein